MRSLAMHEITPTKQVHWDLSTPRLYEHTLERGMGLIAHKGALVVDTTNRRVRAGMGSVGPVPLRPTAAICVRPEPPRSSCDSVRRCASAS